MARDEGDKRLEMRLDALGAEERSHASSSLEDRIFLATAAKVKAGGSRGGVVSRMWAPLAMAASVALVAGVISVALSLGGAKAPSVEPGTSTRVAGLDESEEIEKLDAFEAFLDEAFAFGDENESGDMDFDTTFGWSDDDEFAEIGWMLLEDS